MKNPEIMAFYEDVIAWLPEPSSEAELQELAGLLSSIWNNTPQPGRDGKTANELVRLRYEG